MSMSSCKKAVAALCAALAWALCWSTVASAGLSRSLVGWFGPSGPESGAFVNVQSVAVDASGDVYVYDPGANGGSIYKFDSAGKPVAFSALSGSAITKVGGVAYGENAEGQIAVSPAGPTAGDIYLANDSGNVTIYAPSGNQLGQLSGGCGVATGPTGVLYISLTSGFVDRYAPAGNPVVSGDYTSALYGVPAEPCNIAVDSKGSVYEVKWENGPVTRYDASQFNTSGTAASGTQLDPVGSTVAVDQSTDDVFVDEQDAVTQYDSSLKQRGGFGGGGLLKKSLGVAVAGPSEGEKAYAASGTRVDVFGPGVEVKAPTVNDQAPSVGDVRRTSVVLSGTVNPGSAETTYHFVYGTSEAYGSGTAPAPAGSGNVDTTVGPVGVGNLQAGTTYHYALVASNVEGTVVGPDYTFTTAPRTPPLVSTGAATGVSATTSTLSGTVDPQAVKTSYEFQVGTTASYGGAEIFGNAGEGEAPETVSTSLQYLTPGTTYHYRVVATNEDGTSYGPDQTFTTPAVSSPIVQTPSAPLIAFTPIAFPDEKASAVTTKTKKPHAKKKHGKHKKNGKHKKKK